MLEKYVWSVEICGNYQGSVGICLNYKESVGICQNYKGSVTGYVKTMRVVLPDMFN